VWPGEPVPIPRLERYPNAELDGEHIYLGNRHELAQPPPELYLREARALDPDNPGPVALDVARRIGGPFLFEDIDRGFPPRDIALAQNGARERFAASHGRFYEPADWSVERGYKIHVDEIAYRLRTLYLLGRHAVAYRNGDYLAPAWTGMLTHGTPRTERAAWATFCQLINPALSVFHTRVRVEYADGYNQGDSVPSVLEVGALQLVNDLARQVDYLTCPRCGVVFARQVGGSTHYSRRTGVTYCSPTCATSARVKAYRARKRAERTAHGQR
jgi:uncharacterized C2H2 Zn-finger protein